MKNPLLILCLTSIATISIGQTNVGLKMMAFPNFSFPIYHSDGSSPGYAINLIKESEAASFSFATGAAVKVSLTEKWSISLGFNYLRTGYETKERALNWGSQNPGFDLPTHAKFLYRKTNLEVPLLVERVFFQNEKWSCFAAAGPSWWYNLSNETELVSKYADGRVVHETGEDQSTNFRQTNISALLGVGLAREMAKGIRVFVQPTAQSTLFGLSEEASLNRRLFSAGIMVGVLVN